MLFGVTSMSSSSSMYSRAYSSVICRGGSSWTPRMVRSGAPGFGFYPNLVSDRGKLYYTHFVYDRAAPAGTALGSLPAGLLP